LCLYHLFALDPLFLFKQHPPKIWDIEFRLCRMFFFSVGYTGTLVFPTKCLLVLTGLSDVARQTPAPELNSPYGFQRFSRPLCPPVFSLLGTPCTSLGDLPPAQKPPFSPFLPTFLRHEENPVSLAVPHVHFFPKGPVPADVH